MDSTNKANFTNFCNEMRKSACIEYLKLLNLDVIQSQPLKKYVEKYFDHPHSHQNRISTNNQQIKLTYLNAKSNNVAICFKTTLDGTSCIYAFLYCDCPQMDADNDKVTPNILSTGPTFKSQDGEYRGRLVLWRQFLQATEYYPEAFDIVENMVLSQVESSRQTFQVEYYFPDSCKMDRNKYDEFVNNSRLPIKFFIFAWLYDYYYIHNKVMENHINPAYQFIMYQPEYLRAYDKILTLVGGPKEFYLLTLRISQFRITMDRQFCILENPQVGQKIIPLSAVEAANVDDILYDGWREIYMTGLASNLVINAISPSFSVINNWFYIQSAHGGLFDNDAMHKKYVHSKVSTDISKSLRDIDQYNYVNQERDSGALSGKFSHLSGTINESVYYADAEIRLTDLAICITTEYVGRTVRDFPALVEWKERYDGLDRVLTDVDIFAKHLFEFVYALYAMNSKLGLIHGDLHLNNATINVLHRFIQPEFVEKVKNPHVVYILDGSVYIFPHIGAVSTIIDFSRSIIGNTERLGHDFTPAKADQFMRHQRAQLLRMLKQFFPDLLRKHEDKLKPLLISNFPLVFKILTVVDTFALMKNLSAMFMIEKVFTEGRIKISQESKDFIDKITAFTKSLLTNTLKDIVDGKIKTAGEIEWANLEVIRKFFGKYIMKDGVFMNITITDVFNHENEILYDIEDYDTWGPILSPDKSLELIKKYQLKEIEDEFHLWKLYREYDETVEIDNIETKYSKDVATLPKNAWMFL